jgi:D-alanyl-D-alanine carboxypeptidase
MGQQHHRRRPGRGRGLAAVIAALALAAVATAALAADKNAVMVLDANSGRVLYESAADELRHPASLTKMMTLYLLFERIDQGRLTYQTKIKMSATAVAAAPSKLDLDEGEEITVIDAIRALITKSANDVAVAVAEHMAGSEPAFVRLMNQKARQLGMMSTAFKNASGLPDEDQLTTARDMVTLALHLQDDFPRHFPLFATRTFTYRESTYRNHNTLLFHYAGTQGLKTGYTRASGFNLVACVQRGKKHLFAAIFGGATASSRDSAMRTFLNMGLLKASTERTRKPAPFLLSRSNPAPELAPAAVPTPKLAVRPVLRPMAGQLMAGQLMAGQPMAVQPMTAAPLEPHASQPDTGPIEIARVRRVLVTTHGEERDRSSSIEALLARQDALRPDGARPEPPRLGAPSEAAAWTTAPGTTAPVGLAATAAPAQPVLLAGPLPARGAPPSTLQHQALILAKDQRWQATPTLTTQALPAAAARNRDPASSAVSGAGGFAVQIGAFQSVAEAERQLALVRERVPGVLDRREAITQRVLQGQKVLYRARYAGFDGEAAAGACSELKRAHIDCLVLRAE